MADIETSNDIPIAEGRFKVVSEQIEDGVRVIRISMKDERGNNELGHFIMKDLGKFVYFAGMRVEEGTRGKGVGSGLVQKAHQYLEDNQKFGFVSNQISKVNGARNIYRPPNWNLLSQHNWMIYIPTALRDPNAPLVVPLPQSELDAMVRKCMQN